MIAFLHVSNLLYLLAYLVRDILWLRVLTVVAMLCIVPYYYCCTASPLYTAIVWQAVFVTVNLVQIGLLVSERRPVHLEDEAARLYELVFKPLSRREFARLLTLADWREAAPGRVLLEQGRPVQELLLISSGSAGVEVDGRHVTVVEPGQFVGEMAFLTQQTASASVVARVPLKYLAWPAEALSALLRESPQLHVKVHGVLGADVVEKLRREGFNTAHPSKIMEKFQSGGLE